MGFSAVNWDRVARFNSAESANLLIDYESYVDEKIRSRTNQPSSKTFAPSSFRCPRRSWFRLRGVEPDKIQNPDAALEFSANIGTACHKIIQQNLKDLLKDNWVDVESYLRSQENYPYTYSTRASDDSLESFITIEDPPIKFACDGIIHRNNKYYLLEIKTADYNSWDNLTEEKPEHRAQVNCYATLLGLEHVLMLYQDRTYGGLKCYEFRVTNIEKQEVLDRFKLVQDCVETQIAPPPLPRGDKWCSENYCNYYRKCSEYGRY